MIDPAAFGRESIDELIVEYIDGGLSAEDGRRFESMFECVPDLRSRVERARCLRTLVATLPRVPAPESVRLFTQRMAGFAHASQRASATHARSVSGIEATLGLLPRRSAPQGFADRVLGGIHAERARTALAARRRAYRPSGAELLRAAVAALLLLGVSSTLLSGRSAHRVGSFRFASDFNVVRPGVAQSATRENFVTVDPIAVPFGPSRFERARSDSIPSSRRDAGGGGR